jgi:hypothetical protein
LKKLIPFMTVFMAVIFICNFSVLAAPNPEYCQDDYRKQTILDEYGNVVEKPIAQIAAIRERNGTCLDTVSSYAGMDIYTEFPVLACYVGDTLRFDDLSKSSYGNISSWDWQYYGTLGEHSAKYNYNIVNQTSIYLSEPGETTFFLCVKSDFRVKKGSPEPWSHNGNHQVTGKNKWFPHGMHWYFTAVRVIVKPATEAKVHVRYWDAQRNSIFHEGTVWLGELMENEQTETSVHITDWDGYEYSGWHVVLPDDTLQYSGTERDVGITLAHWLPEKYLNVEFYPYMDTEVQVRYWDSQANRIMFEESVYGEQVVRDKEIKITVPVIEIDGYTFASWNVCLPDGTVQYDGTNTNVEIALNGYFSFKYLNIDYLSNGENAGTPTTPDTPEIIPDKPSEICDGVITWTETDSHRVLTGYDRYGNPKYKTCKHTFAYQAVLEATAAITPSTLKSGYGFEAEVNFSVKTSQIKNEGDDSWGNNRATAVTVKKPGKATVYIPWTTSNQLGTQSRVISMNPSSSTKFILPVSSISESGARKIYTPVELAGTEEEPAAHSFEIYLNGGGVGKVEFCKKLTGTITINGDMYSDDFSGMD